MPDTPSHSSTNRGHVYHQLRAIIEKREAFFRKPIKTSEQLKDLLHKYHLKFFEHCKKENAFTKDFLVTYALYKNFIDALTAVGEFLQNNPRRQTPGHTRCHLKGLFENSKTDMQNEKTRCQTQIAEYSNSIRQKLSAISAAVAALEESHTALQAVNKDTEDHIVIEKSQEFSIRYTTLNNEVTEFECICAPETLPKAEKTAIANAKKSLGTFHHLYRLSPNTEVPSNRPSNQMS